MRRNSQNQGGESMSKKIYISGKMGEDVLSKETKDKFMLAHIDLMAKYKNALIIDPASDLLQKAVRDFCEKDNTINEDYRKALLYDMTAICRCDAIYMLRDWKDSPGATAEYYFAKAVGLEIIFEK